MLPPHLHTQSPALQAPLFARPRCKHSPARCLAKNHVLLQEENQRLKEGGALAAAATEPMEADDEDEARQPSTAKTAAPARLGRGRQQVVEEGDDESDSGEEDRGRSQSPPREYD